MLLAGSFLVGLTVQHENVPRLTLKDCVEIATEYEVLHPEVPPATDWYGVTDIDGRRLYTIRNASLAHRRKTLIHEMLHVSVNMQALPLDRDAEEQAVRVKADALYLELFGQ